MSIKDVTAIKNTKHVKKIQIFRYLLLNYNFNRWLRKSPINVPLFNFDNEC